MAFGIGSRSGFGVGFNVLWYGSGLGLVIVPPALRKVHTSDNLSAYILCDNASADKGEAEMQSYSQDLRDRVLWALDRGERPAAIARRLEVSRVWVTGFEAVSRRRASAP